MNCDQAFDCLTDSERRHSPELAEHMARCERCRQMHDTLEPALDLFDDLVPEPDLSHGGVAMQTLAPETVRLAGQAALRLSGGGQEAGGRRRALILRYAAAAMAGALLMGVMGSINRVQSPEDAGAPITTITVATPIPEFIPPDDDGAGPPAPVRADCILISGAIDRQNYPTPFAVVQRCTECHQEPGDTGFPDNAQPISIEAPADPAKTADLIVRALSTRARQRMIASGSCAQGRDVVPFA